MRTQTLEDELASCENLLSPDWLIYLTGVLTIVDFDYRKRISFYDGAELEYDGIEIRRNANLKNVENQARSCENCNWQLLENVEISPMAGQKCARSRAVFSIFTVKASRNIPGITLSLASTKTSR